MDKIGKVVNRDYSLATWRGDSEELSQYFGMVC